MSLWPAKYLVTECITKSAPNSSGFCVNGVAKVLSTATPTPNFLAPAIIVFKSTFSSAGLVGDSNQSSAAPFAASNTAAVLVASTKRTSSRPLS